MTHNLTKLPISTLIAIAIFLFLVQPYLFGSGAAILFILVWLPYTLINGIVSRKQWQIWLMKLACWLMAFGIAYAMHHLYNQNARKFAQKVVDDLQIYQEKHGHYPKAETWKAQQNQPIPYRLNYFCSEQCDKNQALPIVDYTSALSVFDKYVYDFERQEWRHDPD